jgi:hypothetical protein
MSDTSAREIAKIAAAEYRALCKLGGSPDLADTIEQALLSYAAETERLLATHNELLSEAEIGLLAALIFMPTADTWQSSTIRRDTERLLTKIKSRVSLPSPASPETENE